MRKEIIPLLIMRIILTSLRIHSDHALGPLPCVPGCGRGRASAFMKLKHGHGDYIGVTVDIRPIVGVLG